MALFGVIINEEKKTMMRIFTMFLSFFIALLQMIGISGNFTPTAEHYTDFEGVYITIESIENGQNGKVINAMWHNESDVTVCFGKGYTIEYLNGESWEDVQIVDFAIPEIACILDGGQTATESYRTQYFNMLRPGTYRIKTEFWIQDDFVLAEQTTYAIFEVDY